MVGYLHRSGANEYPFNYQGSIAAYTIHSKPVGLLLNEGHTANGAAGSGIIFSLAGLGLAWSVRRGRRRDNGGKASTLLFSFAILMSVYFIFVTAALAYVFWLTRSTSGQAIDKALAASLNGAGPAAAYPLDQWTPENWFKAMLDLPLSDPTDISYVRGWLRVIEGWKWNLIPMMLVSCVVAVVSWGSVREDRRIASGGGKGYAYGAVGGKEGAAAGYPGPYPSPRSDRSGRWLVSDR